MAKPLLEIRVDDMDSVPVVYYNGEKIEHKVQISYGWKTQDGDRLTGQHSMTIKYMDEKAGEIPVIRTIENERLSHEAMG